MKSLKHGPRHNPETYSARILRNIEYVYSVASERDKTDGLAWYSNARDAATKLASRYAVPFRTVAGIIAVLSPGRAWEVNLRDAEYFIGAFTRGARGRALPSVGTYGFGNVGRAERIALGEDLLQVTSPRGRKVRAFYQAICGDDNAEVCIDRHAYGAALGRPLTETELAIPANLYRKLSNHYRLLAKRGGIAPWDYQAIVWVTWRNLSEVPF